MGKAKAKMSICGLIVRTIGILCVVGVILAGWWFFGFVFPYWYAQQIDPKILPRSGQFGDGFNAAATLFTGVALCGTIYALILQQKEIAKGDEEAERQLKIAQDTAKLQTLSFFARLQIQEMAGATKEMQLHMRRLADFYGNRTLKLMEEMGEDFTPLRDILPRCGIVQMTSRMGALSILSQLADELESLNNPFTLASASIRMETNETPASVLIRKAQQMDVWLHDYASLFSETQLGYLSGFPYQLREAARPVDFVRTSAMLDGGVKDWVSRQQHFPRAIREARNRIETELLGDARNSMFN